MALAAPGEIRHERAWNAMEAGDGRLDGRGALRGAERLTKTANKGAGKIANGPDPDLLAGISYIPGRNTALLVLVTCV